MHRNMDHDEFTRRQRCKAIQIASDMLEGRQSPLLGSRELCSLELELSEDDREGILRPFVVIDSATDTLPLGAERSNWQASALRAKEREIQRQEKLHRADALQGCRELLEQLKRDV